MVSRIHAIAPRLAIALGLAAPVVAVGAYVWYLRPYEVPPDTDIFAAVAGTWAWTTADSGCSRDWHRITFTADHTVMTIKNSKPYKRPDGRLDSVAVYDIQTHTRSLIRGAIRGETRVTPAGRAVVWDLVLRSPDRYAWHRTDWFDGAYTRQVRRCPEPQEASSATGRPPTKPPPESKRK
ncbi:MAG TPA: hypothetical protein VEU55_04935 [Gemmatimonadales bacterium]|nr:hypothetical protein [Gemmatimonadales bacterium]